MDDLTSKEYGFLSPAKSPDQPINSKPESGVARISQTESSE